MKGYQELVDKLIFNFDEALDIFSNNSTTYSALNRLTKNGLVKKIRNNLYAIINPVTQNAYADKYQIGSSINPNCYISHISALEYYGYLNQVNNFCYISSPKRFNEFDFEGITYKYVNSNSIDGVITPPYSFKIKITNLEKTVIDTIQGINSIIDLEQVINSFQLIAKLDEKKLIKYLEEYHIQALFQKTIYLLFLMNDKLQLSDDFYIFMQSKIKKGVTYLSDEARIDGVFVKEYQLVVPRWLFERRQQNAL